MACVESVTIRGFKSIRTLDDLTLGRLNVLIGPNGSGKSNFLAVFRMLGSLARGRFRLFVGHEGGPEACVFGGLKTTSSLYVKVSLDEGRSSYEAEANPSGSSLLIRKEELAGAGSSSYEGPWGGAESFLSNDLRDTLAAPIASQMRRWRVFHFQDTSREAAVRNPSEMRDNLSLRSNGGNLAPFLRFLNEHHRESYRRIVSEIRVAFPTFDNFVCRETTSERMDLEWFRQDFREDTPQGPFQLSDGTLRYMCLATLLNQPVSLKPNPIVIDEPELGLHPRALALLAESLREVSDERQVIVSTQSADLVSELSPEEVIAVSLSNGETTFRRLDGERLSEWLEDYALGDLWRMNVVGG